MIFIAGISIALFISSLLLVKKGKSKSDTFLFLWMMLNAVHLGFFYLLHTGAIYNYPYLLGLQFPLPLLHGVFLYYYVSSVTNQFSKKKLFALLHILPTIITLIYLIPFFFLPADQKVEIFKNGGQAYKTFQTVLLVGISLSGIIYVIWSNLLLKKHNKRIRKQFSDIEEINLRWLQFLTYGLGLVWCLVIIVPYDTIIFSAVSVFVIFIGFYGIQQEDIFVSNKVIIEIENNEEVIAKKEKYLNSGLSNEKADEYSRKLNGLINQDKIYKNADLSLVDLASKLEIHPNYLSQIINEIEGETFYDYINTYRVEEFKRLISYPKNQQFTLMAIAYDCGFNSKSSFNRYFKKITNQTPSQYLKSISE